MDVRMVRHLALLSAILGLILLFLASRWIDVTANIAAISLADAGASRKVCGEVTGRRVSNNHAFLTLDDGTGAIRLVVFNSSLPLLEEQGIDPLGFAIGDRLCARGDVAEYPAGSGQLELIYDAGELRYDP